MCELMDDICCATCGYNKSENEDVAVCEIILGKPEEKAIDDCCSCYDSDTDPLPRGKWVSDRQKAFAD